MNPKAFAPIELARPCYTLASRDGTSAEITMYGQIVESRPIDWWTGEPIDGNFIVLDDFLDDLATLSGVRKLTIRLNSLGGDAYSSITIHNRLREMKAKVIAIVDGVAMSGGSLIMCAADTVRVNPSSVIMIHRCWSFLCGAYNADDLAREIGSNETMDKAQMEIYKRKCGMSDNEILALMSAETYMTGREAVERGFADELIEDAPAPELGVSADRRKLLVNGHMMRIPLNAALLPPGISTIAPPAEPAIPPAHASAPTSALPIAPAHAPDKDKPTGGMIMATNLDELRAENPELAQQLLAEAAASAAQSAAASANDAVTRERQRLSEIDAIANLFDDELVSAAKYGDDPCTAQELAYRAALKSVEQGRAFVAAIAADAAASGSDQVVPAPAAVDEPILTNADIMAQGRADARRILNVKEDK